MNKEELLLGNLVPQNKNKVGDLMKLFETRIPPNKKTARERQPPNQDRKTNQLRNNTRKSISDIQCDPVKTDKNNSETDEMFVKFSDDVFRRQPLVDFNLLENIEMHDLPTDDDTVVQESCTTSVQRMSRKKLPILKEKALSLPLQPTSPPQEQL